MPRTPLLAPLLAFALFVSCSQERPAATSETEPAPMQVTQEPSPVVEGVPTEVPEPPTVFDAAEAIFDTLEPPPRPGIEIPEVTAPTPRPPPPRPSTTPLPAPEPLPPPLPPPPVAGSCDVTATESYCFTYTGAAWSAPSAEEHCATAPDATFSLGECPTEGRIGTCVFRRGETPSREIIYTYYEPYDLGLARIACPGRFTEE